MFFTSNLDCVFAVCGSVPLGDHIPADGCHPLLVHVSLSGENKPFLAAVTFFLSVVGCFCVLWFFGVLFVLWLGCFWDWLWLLTLRLQHGLLGLLRIFRYTPLFKARAWRCGLFFLCLRFLRSFDLVHVRQF
jgi:hypothetical protein